MPARLMCVRTYSPVSVIRQLTKTRAHRKLPKFPKVSVPPSRFANSAANASFSGLLLILTVGSEEVIGGADRLGEGT